MKQLILMVVLAVVSVTANADEIADKATISAPFGNPPIIVDGERYHFRGYPTSYSPGHHVFVTAHNVTVPCDLEGGHVYVVDDSCIDNGRRMDFSGAKEYWGKIEDKKYQADKEALANAKTEFELAAIVRSLEWRLKNGINRDDPDHLLKQAQEKLAPYIDSERKKAELRVAELENARAALEKEESNRLEKKRQKLSAFRKNLVEGDETNCGPIIEIKAKLIKVSFAVDHYGSEHWIRREETYPAGYGCRFINGEYQPQLTR